LGIVSIQVSKSLGKWGEETAAEYLTSCGFQVLELNARTSYGELDIVARQGEEILFAEVNTRRTTTFGLPEDAISRDKQQHLIQSAEAYMQSHPEYGDNWRIDVIAILRRPGLPPELLHFENAVI
jgi:putative endonuclease